MATLAEALRLGYQFHQEGDLEQAENIYRQILEAAPSEAQAWCLLGCVALSQSHYPDAITSFTRAISHRPHFPEAHNNLGYALAQEGKTAEAMAFYHRALELKPDYADAQNNLGTALAELGRVEEAISCYRQAIALNPSYAAAHNNLGVGLARIGRIEEALASFREAVRIWPQYVSAYIGLGSAMGRLGNWQEAAATLERALAIDPESSPAHNNLGLVYARSGKLDEAVERFQSALRLAPNSPEAHNNLGHTMLELGFLEEARSHYRDALRCKPDYASAHSNLLMALAYDPGMDSASLLQEHRDWERDFGYSPMPAAAVDGDPGRRLRIGYVSADLRKHPVAAFLKPILSHHDPEHMQVFCYAESLATDSLTEDLRGLAHAWRGTCGLSDQQLADQIRADGIDILVDLAGHSGDSRVRVFTFKPAPVQITYLGYPNTTGLSAIDYLLTDAVVDPAENDQYCAEALWRLAGGFCCFAPRQDAPEVTPSQSQARSYITFGSTHALAKINADVLDLWCELLKAIPTSRLLIVRHTLSNRARTRLQNEFRKRGISGGQLELRSRIESGDFLDVYHDIDILLDTFPWCGHTSACEAAWMGVPTLTLPGPRRSSRLVASVLGMMGLSDWIARTPAEFVAKGIAWDGDSASLASLRLQLRSQMAQSPLCDGVTFTRTLETAFRAMWKAKVT